MDFFPPHIKMLQEEGHVVELAANFSEQLCGSVAELGCKIHQIPFSRNAYSVKNIKAYLEIKRLIDMGQYDIVHTHTPNASAIVRLACRKMRKRGLKVIYTAHGFHFYRGAPVKNWLLFFPVEWICACWTDVLVTINHEDYRRAKRFMRAGKVEYVPGVGIDIEKFQKAEIGREEVRESIGVRATDIVLLSLGELNRNKNHEVVIRALAERKNSTVHYIIAGRGELFDYLQRLATRLGVADKVHLLGYREDVASLYCASDIYLLPSFREGLNVSLMEAMASGLPCIASRIRGNVDLIVNERGGLLCQKNQIEDYVMAIEKLCNRVDLRKTMGKFNMKKIAYYGNDYVTKQIARIYSCCIQGKQGD